MAVDIFARDINMQKSARLQIKIANRTACPKTDVCTDKLPVPLVSTCTASVLYAECLFWRKKLECVTTLSFPEAKRVYSKQLEIKYVQ
jgi:hypothetical protein